MEVHSILIRPRRTGKTAFGQMWLEFMKGDPDNLLARTQLKQRHAHLFPKPGELVCVHLDFSGASMDSLALRICHHFNAKKNDPQRVTRALAVLNATGRSLASFQDEASVGLLDGWEIEKLLLNPDREVLRERIARRFETMFAEGAVEEVRALLTLDLDPSLPAMKAIGVPEIAAMLNGELSQAAAIERAVIATRQYAKRQRTWFRSRMADWQKFVA